MSENKAKLNPQIVTAEIGVRNLRKITIYPLSMADELKLTNLFMGGITEFFKDRNPDDIPLNEFVTYLGTFIQDNIVEILSYVTDPEEIGEIDEAMKDITNLQFLQIASTIYRVNFEDVAKEKNVKSLLEKVRKLFQLRRPSVPSVSVTGTDSKTSTRRASGKEE